MSSPSLLAPPRPAEAPPRPAAAPAADRPEPATMDGAEPTEPTAPAAAEEPVDDRYDRPDKGARRKWIDAGVAVLLVALGAGALAALKSLHQEAAPVDRVTPAPLVETVEVTSHTGGLDVDADGVVVPFREIAVGAEVAGRVVEMDPACRSGRYVSAGQTLLTIDPEPYRLEAKRLEQEVKSAETNLAELEVQIRGAEDAVRYAKADAELAVSEADRQRRLRDRNSGSAAAVEAAERQEIASKEKLNAAANQLRLLIAQRDRLGVQKELAETRSERARLDLSRTTVASPVEGVIVSTGVEEGGQVAVGAPLFTVDDISAAEVRTNLRMKDVAWILAHPPEGTAPPETAAQAAAAAYSLPEVPVTVEYDLLGNTYAWNGVLSRVEGAGIDERTRTVPCRVRVDQPRNPSMVGGAAALPVAPVRALLKGMFVTVKVHTAPSEPLLEIPETAVRPGNRVWAVRDGALRIATIPVAAIVGGKVLVPPGSGEVTAGDRLVVSPLPSASPGMKVRVAGEDGDGGTLADDLAEGEANKAVAEEAAEPPGPADV